MSGVSTTVHAPAEEPEVQSGADAEISIPSSTLVKFDPKSDTIRGELVQIIAAWLIEQGFTSTAQLLRDEAAALLRQEHNERKALRVISRAIQEGNWDAAHGQLKKLDPVTKSNGAGNADTPSQPASLLQSMAFLLSQQQFLEYVDEDDGQRAHVFFMRRIKPMEATISKDHFQQLIYLLTCRTVSEAGGKFPVWRGWTPMVGRSQLQSILSKAIGYCDSSLYCRQYECGFDEGPNAAFKSLEQILTNSLSYELLKSKHPSLLSGLPIHSVFSIQKPMGEQLIPSNLLTSIDVNKLRGDIVGGTMKGVSLTACQPFLQVPALAVGTYTGSILWIPIVIERDSVAVPSNNDCFRLYQYNAPVRGMASHERQILLSWSGCQAVVLNMAQLMWQTPDSSDASEYLKDCVANTFVHTADVYSSCLFPCGYILATGLSEGTVTVWDLLTGTQMFHHSFSNSAIVSLTTNRTGSCYYAASKEGLVRVVDVTTGVLLFSFTSPVASEVSSIALSPSSSLLLVSYRSGTLRLWDVLTGGVLPQRFEGIESNTRRCASVCFGCVDSHIISGHDDGFLYLWDLAHARTKHQSLHVNPAAEMLSPDASQKEAPWLHSSSVPGRYHWPLGEALPPPKRIRLHRSPITDVKFQHHYVVTCGDDGVVCICHSVPKCHQ
ncbi:hypothetical protein DQ04_00691190 [Trypanosoma grayi]|uniref:hypothetical protein n=1 Tax=Trypanosoma grayi TaxID=71804 RepID=UPI0004F484F9|nr:hypothetical protein DQ04_00691190 [Trypanosoma grayi]KEG13973.1 hypothetical protein DQ04_00691190 [Trypanosoma grayi]